MANIRYAKKMISFLGRYNEEQRAKITRVANNKNITEAEAARLMVDAYVE